MKGERIKRVEFPVFAGFTVHIVVSDDVVKSRIDRDDYFGDAFEGTANAMHTWSSIAPYESWIFLHPLATPGTISHECWHAVQYMLSWVGATLDNELVAYHLEYLVDKAWQHIRPAGHR